MKPVKILLFVFVIGIAGLVLPVQEPTVIPELLLVDYFLHEDNLMYPILNLSHPLKTVTLINNPNGDNLIGNWTTLNSINSNFIPNGLYQLHFHGKKVGASKVSRIFFSFYILDSDGNKKYIGNSTYCSGLENNVEHSEDITLQITSSLSTNLTDKLYIEIFVNQTGLGTNPDIYFYYDDATNSRLILPLNQVNESDPIAMLNISSNIVKWNSGSKGDYSFLIYKDGVNYIAKNGVDGTLLINDTNARVVIQAAIDNLSGGIIEFMPSNSFYNIDGTIYYDENIEFKGLSTQADDIGYYSVTLKRNGNYSIFAPKTKYGIRYVKFSNLVFLGRGVDLDNAAMVTMNSNTSQFLFDYIVCRQSLGDCVYAGGDSWGITMNNPVGQSLGGYLIKKEQVVDNGTLININNPLISFSNGIAWLYGTHTLNIVGGGGDQFITPSQPIIFCQECSGEISGLDFEGNKTVGSNKTGIYIYAGSVNIHNNRFLNWGGYLKYPILLGGEGRGGNVYGNMAHISATNESGIFILNDSENWNVFNNNMDKVVGNPNKALLNVVGNTTISALSGVGDSYIGANSEGRLSRVGAINISDNTKVNKTGDTITGDLILTGGSDTSRYIYGYPNTNMSLQFFNSSTPENNYAGIFNSYANIYVGTNVITQAGCNTDETICSTSNIDAFGYITNSFNLNTANSSTLTLSPIDIILTLTNGFSKQMVFNTSGFYATNISSSGYINSSTAKIGTGTCAFGQMCSVSSTNTANGIWNTDLLNFNRYSQFVLGFGTTAGTTNDRFWQIVSGVISEDGLRNPDFRIQNWNGTGYTTFLLFKGNGSNAKVISPILSGSGTVALCVNASGYISRSTNASSSYLTC